MVFGSQLDGIKILILPFLEFQIIQIFPGSMGTLEPFLSLSSANLSKDFWYYCILYIVVDKSHLIGVNLDCVTALLILGTMLSQISARLQYFFNVCLILHLNISFGYFLIKVCTLCIVVEANF